MALQSGRQRQEESQWLGAETGEIQLGNKVQMFLQPWDKLEDWAHLFFEDLLWLSQQFWA